MHLPHSNRIQLQHDRDGDNGFRYVRCLLGFLNYLQQLVYNDDGSIRIGAEGHYASAGSYLLPLPERIAGEPIFGSQLRALEYIEGLAHADM